MQEGRNPQKIRSETRELGEARSLEYLLMYTPLPRKVPSTGMKSKDEEKN